MKPELKPCPFCGGRAYLARKGTHKQSSIVECESCGCCLETSEEGDQCGETWNRRAPADSDDRSDWCRFEGCSHKKAGSPVWERVAEPVKCETCKDSGIVGHSEICPSCADKWKPAEPVKVPTDYLQGLSDRAYSQYIEQMRRNECLGWEQKVKNRRFGEAELNAHTKAGEFLGRHRAFSEAVALLAKHEQAQRQNEPQNIHEIIHDPQPTDTAIGHKGDIVGWLRRRADYPMVSIPGKLASEIADHIESLSKKASSYDENLLESRNLKARLDQGEYLLALCRELLAAYEAHKAVENQ